MAVILNSEEYQAWHEIGHAVTCILLGGHVEFVSFIDDPNHFAVAVARCAPIPETRKHVLCGGFAAECILLQKGLLESIDQASFTQSIIENSRLDKSKFFEVSNDYNFSRKQTEEFNEFAINFVVPLLDNYVDKMQALVAMFMVTGRLEGQFIKDLIELPEGELL